MCGGGGREGRGGGERGGAEGRGRWAGRSAAWRARAQGSHTHVRAGTCPPPAHRRGKAAHVRAGTGTRGCAHGGPRGGEGRGGGAGKTGPVLKMASSAWRGERGPEEPVDAPV